MTTKIGWKTAAGLVVANMVGTGVFTSLGFQLPATPNSWAILLLWLLGGILALIGAFTYAELGTYFKGSGGDYVFLTRAIHPFAGYLYAWVSLTVGFSAPIAISAMAMGAYLRPFGQFFSHSGFGIAIILLLAAVLTTNMQSASRFQNSATVLKILFVLVLITLGVVFAPFPDNALDFASGWASSVWQPGFAVSLVYVTYAYTGWNAAAYITDEIENPRKSLPKALIGSVAIVTLMYLALQLVLLKHATHSQLSGQVEVATIAFGNLFGQTGALWVGAFIALQLVATISGYLWVGSRVTQAMAQGHTLWRHLAKSSSRGIPVRALWAQAFISIILVLSGSFEQVLVYVGFVLQLMGMLSVASILWLKPKPQTFQSPLRPFLQLLYLVCSGWILTYTLIDKPVESLVGLGIVAIGAVTYFFGRLSGTPSE